MEQRFPYLGSVRTLSVLSFLPQYLASTSSIKESKSSIILPSVSIETELPDEFGMKSLVRRHRRSQAKAEKQESKEGGREADAVKDGCEVPGEDDVVEETLAPKPSATASSSLGPVKRCPSHRRLMKEFQQYSTNQNEYFDVELVDEKLTDWNIKVFKFDPESRISQDMTRLGIQHVVLNAVFPDDYPLRPPFLRVVCPRIENGYILRGGAICMELLTPKGWSAAYTIEAIVMQFVSTLVKGKGKISVFGKNKEYKKKDAEKTFRDVVMLHEAKGWRTPPKWEG
jgi:ubiquitin-conjugating enzyme E2 Q